MNNKDILMKKQTGFSLLELMMALAIIGILGAISYPAYTDYVIKARRSDAQANIMQLATIMERAHTANFTYLDGTDQPVLATVFGTDELPIDGNTKYYTLSFPVALTATTYTIRATPIAGTVQKDDGFMEYLSVGTKTWDKNNNNAIDSGESTWSK